MLEFMQGFAYGLFLTCPPWFLVGMVNPALAVPTESPSRLEVIGRYCLGIPFIGFLLWLTSLWGGFDPSLLGWLAGLGAIAVELPLERSWRRWRVRRRHQRLEALRADEAAKQRAQVEREARESGVAILDPDRPPAGADDVILALCQAKRGLENVGRLDLATQADRLYSRYANVADLLDARFSPSELAYARSRGLVSEVCLGAVDNLTAMANQAQGVAGVDSDFVRRRLDREGKRLSVAERVALKRRLELVDETERHLRELTARNESALTVLDDTAVALSRVQTDRPQASVAADQALSDLRRFIERAERYGRS
ncbi:hypothetical protein [Litchfieldella xinjiangensis]|uniref:hypothetical protein n=1 Tax=Litchfieldella xinjiangensis TaxID=1166948 RepID=UPI0005BD565C|nr:hypothetical protein [Halomonas xinjiangensis]